MDNALVTHPQTPQEASAWYRENLASDASGAKRAPGSMEGVQQTGGQPPAGSQGMMDGRPGSTWSPAQQQQQASVNGAPAVAQASLSMPQGSNGQVAGGKTDGADPSQSTVDAGGKNGLTVAGSGIVPVLQ
jgi:hypothetical protein